MKWSIDAISRSMYKYCVGIKCVCACCRWRFIRFWRAKNTKMAKIAVPSSCHYLTQHSIVSGVFFVALNSTIDANVCATTMTQAVSAVNRRYSRTQTHTRCRWLERELWIRKFWMLRGTIFGIAFKLSFTFDEWGKKNVEENKTIDKITSMTMAMATMPPLPQRTIDNNERITKEDAEKRCLPFRVSVRVNTHKAQDKSIELLLIVIGRHNRMSFFACLLSISTWITQTRRERIGQSSMAEKENQ